MKTTARALTLALGMRYCAGAAFRTAFAGMMDFDPAWRDSLRLNLEGKPITVPWLSLSGAS